MVVALPLFPVMVKSFHGVKSHLQFVGRGDLEGTFIYTIPLVVVVGATANISENW